MGKRRSLSSQLTYLLLILVLSVLVATGLSTFFNNSTVYMRQNEQRLMNIVDYLAKLTKIDGEEFVAYQNIMLEYGDEILIPHDFDDYHPAKVAFYKAFNEEYPGKEPGMEIRYEDMPKELKILYGTYKHEYWLHVFENARDSFGIDYCYYVVPTGKGLHMYYMIDAAREEKEVDGKKYILLNADVDQPLESHQHMWDAWESGEYVPGFDITNNEYGINCVYCYPLIINGRKLGVVCSDISFDKVNQDIVNNTIVHVACIALIVFILCFVLSWMIGAKYIHRLVTLKEDISEYASTKNTEISYRIMQNARGNDEIYDLAKQTSVMISEIGKYMTSLEEKNNELSEAQKRIKEANELANRDALTGIRNRAAYDNEVEKIDKRIHGDNFSKFGIVMVDLNNLKTINDSFGHEKGNVAIKKICSMVCRKFAHSPVFRVGGDEFVVILENEDYNRPETLVKELKREIEAVSSKESLEPWERISAAIGWTVFDPQKDKNVESVVKRADALMYEDKKIMKAGR